MVHLLKEIAEVKMDEDMHRDVNSEKGDFPFGPVYQYISEYFGLSITLF